MSVQSFVFIISIFLLTGCPLVRATGDAVKSTGEGAAHAIEGTGDAVGRAGHELTR